MTTATTPMLTLRGVSKSFGAGRALSMADLEIGRGEIHALVGQNGSGKSTMIKILAGLVDPDVVDSCTYRGQPFAVGSPQAARDGGIRFVHQDLGLIASLTVAENLALGGSYAGRFWIGHRKERRLARAVLHEFGLHISPDRLLGSLSIAEQTMVAIARVMHDSVGDHLLVLDEPTASLPGPEVQALFDLLVQIRERGGSVLYVTHRLAELKGLADRVTVLRDGSTAADLPMTDVTQDGLVELMVGAPPGAFYPSPPQPRTEVLVRVAELAGRGVRGVSFDLHRGEILGLTGLVGSGYDEVLPLIFGGTTPDSGTVTVRGRQLRLGSPSAAVEAGLAYAPADRRTLSTINEWTVRENVTVPRIPRAAWLSWLDARSETKVVRPWLSELNVQPSDPDRAIKTLSGGNQQKVVLARWLRCEPAAFLLDEPTNGIDTGSKHAIYETLARTARDGAAIVIASSDVDELAAVCDRVVIMQGGRTGSVLEGADLTAERISTETIRAPEPIESVDLPAIQLTPREAERCRGTPISRTLSRKTQRTALCRRPTDPGHLTR